MSLYAYCLSDEVTAQMIEHARGVADASPFLIEHEGLAAVVSNYEGGSVSVTRENVLAHERVVQQALVEATLLPFRFGTLVSESRLRSYLTLQRGALESQLARVRGCVEMSVKVIRAREVSESETGVEGSRTRDEHTGAEDLSGGAGTSYLLMKRREIAGDELLKERAEELARWLAERLDGAARESVASVRPKEMLVVAASYLVERERLEEYGARLREARRERLEIHFLTSGPWPPYSFSSISS